MLMLYKATLDIIQFQQRAQVIWCILYVSSEYETTDVNDVDHALFMWVLCQQLNTQSTATASVVASTA